MWIFCRDGFFSIVSKPGPGVVHEDMLTVRARVRSDLVSLCEYLQEDPDRLILASRPGDGQDYPFRVVLHRDDVALWLGHQVGLLDYSNFKAAMLRQFGAFREQVYSRVWSALISLEALNQNVRREVRDE